MKILIVFLIFFTGLKSPEPRVIPLYIGSEKFIVEIADTPLKKMRGMMFRRSMPDNFGMLFVYKKEQTLGYWMKNTLIHLDIIYLNKDKQVVDMYINVPPCRADPCMSYISRKKAQYVLELRGKRSAELKMKKGDIIFFVLDE